MAIEWLLIVAMFQILFENVASHTTKVTSWFALIVLQEPINLHHDAVHCFVGKLLWIGTAMVGKDSDQSGVNLPIFLPGLFPVRVKPFKQFVESFLGWGLSGHREEIAIKKHKRHKF